MAPMAGKIIKVSVNVGDQVEEDQEIFILAAMKMEMPIVAPTSGSIKEIHVSAGQAVESNAILAVIE